MLMSLDYSRIWNSELFATLFIAAQGISTLCPSMNAPAGAAHRSRTRRADQLPDCLDRRARFLNLYLENTMNVKNLIAAVAVFAAAGSAFAQQTEFVAPDAGFQSRATRAEVRQDLAQAASEGAIAQRQHDGQDTVYASSRNRLDVRAEAIRAASSRHYGDVNDTYFGG
jgi:hypothetical protein